MSTGREIKAYSLWGELLRKTALEGAGALCAWGTHLFCADDSGMIWRFDKHTLMPQALYSGGPGVCDLALSRDGHRLYALCADADSVLLIDARSGKAQVVAYAGCNPRHMTFDADILAVAGGESGCVHLLDALSLETIACISMPGPVTGAAISGGVVYALCVTPALSAQLAVMRPDGRIYTTPLEGMPGRILLSGSTLIAAVCGRIYMMPDAGKGGINAAHAPGRAGRLCCTCGRIYLYDLLSERLYFCERESVWRTVCCDVRDIAVG